MINDLSGSALSESMNKEDKCMKTFKNGFTLAEVLLTLAIVGIVAALTIPALLNSTQQGELKSSTKKALSSLNQAIVMGIAQDSSDLSAQKTDVNLVDFFKTKLNAISSNNATGLGTASITTADGMIYYFGINTATNGCGENTTAVDSTTNANCYVIVDVNGSKGRSTFEDKKGNGSATSGACTTLKDQYAFVLRSNVAIPANNNDGAVSVGGNCTEHALK